MLAKCRVKWKTLLSQFKFECLYLTDTTVGEKALDYFRFTRRTAAKDLMNFISSTFATTPEQFIRCYDVFADIGGKVAISLKTQQMTNTHILNFVDEKKMYLDGRKMSNEKSMELWNMFQMDLIHSNVSLEGNSFTREETEMLLLGTLQVNTHSEKEK
jgi:hypothetical protein